MKLRRHASSKQTTAAAGGEGKGDKGEGDEGGEEGEEGGEMVKVVEAPPEFDDEGEDEDDVKLISNLLLEIKVIYTHTLTAHLRISYSLVSHPPT